MIELKRGEEIEQLRRNNDLVSRTLALVGEHIKEGVTTAQLDKIAEEFILAAGAVPAFKGYGGFPATLCTSVNNVVVHGVPSESTVLKNGDIVSIDCGAFMNGFFSDSAYTFGVGEISDENKRLLRVTKEALYKSIEVAKVGARIGDISYAVQSHCETNGFTVVREMVGHGLGRALHEEPQVPNFGHRGSGVKLVEGMVLCIEPMINSGTRNVVFTPDGTCLTRDGKSSAHFELCIAIRGNGQAADVLSTFDYIKNQ